MRLVRLFLGIVVFLMLSISYCYAGGGWPQKKNGLYLKLSYWQVVYSKSFDSNGFRVIDRKRGIYNGSIYAEYGVSDRLTTTLYFPFYTKVSVAQLYDQNSGNIVSEGEELSSIGDAEFSIKYGIFKNDYISISPSLLFGIPFGVTSGGEDGTLWTGDGELNTMLRLDVGGSLKIKNRFPYYNAYVGFNNRTNNFSNELRYGLEIGSEFGKLLVIGRMDAVKSMKNGNANTSQQISGIQLNNSEYLNLSFELGFNITKKVGISANFTKAVMGKLIFTNPSFSFGVFVKL